MFSEFERILDDFIDNEKQFEYFDSIAVFEIVIGLNNDSNIYIMLSSGRKMYDTIFQPESTNKKTHICFYYKNNLFIVFFRSDIPIQKLFNITSSKQIIYFINNTNTNSCEDDRFFPSLWVYVFKDGLFYEGRKFEGTLVKKSGSVSN